MVISSWLFLYFIDFNIVHRTLHGRMHMEIRILFSSVDNLSPPHSHDILISLPTLEDNIRIRVYISNYVHNILKCVSLSVDKKMAVTAYIVYIRWSFTYIYIYIFKI